ncbi:hypothetical protein B0T26DRAFT_771021 [Lasiosphaeria miniovina]|uniref:Uncharacterized protein n=1 Tax=Lasiosphaeria miniovina TaxID=1954250 RepID=A0AA40AUX5_9PEZI|nr:uncharacterized protein B0T26DRAFT_771021 [Lasiosphaeria miniovina]KAK0722477.1 hypothetical protein B0T26DRAFT_771021 [Lasiosphaeria miniovina]
MDDAARLVSELHDRLAELDGKVAAYQRDLLAEFHRHMEDCLKQYPVHVSNEILRVIAESLARYPALSPTSPTTPAAFESDRPPSGLSLADRKAWDGRKSPPPILYHTSGVPKEGPRSPHQREKEFQGLFTPTYLPLLDSTYHSVHSPPRSPVPVTPTATLDAAEPEKVEKTKEPEVAKLEIRPAPVRRLTDLSSSSIESSGSESKARRSALRRSLSSTRGSPRRVRFEFKGEEVFPSASPQALIELALVDEAEPLVKAADTSAKALGDESPAYTGTSLLDVEGEEDSFPRPKKVSSTQALRALTRSPLDEGTVWTVVNPSSDDTPKMNGGKAIDTSLKVESRIAVQPQHAVAENHVPDELLGSPIEELENHEDEDASDEEFLSIRPKSSPKAPSLTVRSPFGQLPALSSSEKSKSAAGRINDSDLGDDEDPLFDFEQEGSRKSAAPLGQPSKYIDEDEEEYDGKGDETPRGRSLRLVSAADDATGTATTTEQPAPQAVNLPPVSPSAVLFSQSVGSYKGNPMRFGPMTDARLYDEIASMKDVRLVIGSIRDAQFVGSIDRRNNVDAADLGSYSAASLSRAFAGTPRSFTERLALEEAMERRRAQGDTLDGGEDGS